jgi:hypothetical protein
MNKAIKKAPPSHGPGAITGGAQNKTACDSEEAHSNQEVLDCLDEQPKQRFSPDLWRNQVILDPVLVSSQKLILLVLSTAFDEEGHCETTHDWLAEKTATGVRLIREYTPQLEELGWYRRTRRRHSMEYQALRGWTNDD